jgi:hypothetical protein
MNEPQDRDPGPDAPASAAELAAAGALGERLEGELAPGRAEVVLARVLASGALPGPARRAGFRWAWPAGGLAAAAAAFLLLGPSLGPAPASLPPPPRDLLRAQAEALAGDTAPLAREMRAYRLDVLAAVEARYRRAP